MECRYYSNAGNDAIFRDFPHEFKCKITFRLTAQGLEQEVMFANRSAEPMPCLLYTSLSSIDLAISASVTVLYSANTTMVSSCIISRYWLDI